MRNLLRSSSAEGNDSYESVPSSSEPGTTSTPFLINLWEEPVTPSPEEASQVSDPSLTKLEFVTPVSDATSIFRVVSFRGKVGDDSLHCEDPMREGREDGGSLSGEEDSCGVNDGGQTSAIGVGLETIEEVRFSATP